MPIHTLNGKTPRLAEDVFVAPGAVIIGDVTIGPGSSVWCNAVIRGDAAPITIGAGTNIQDGAVLHADPGFPCVVGDGVTVGHAAVVRIVASIPPAQQLPSLAELRARQTSQPVATGEFIRAMRASDRY